MPGTGLAVTNSMQLRYIAETTPGTTPVTGAMQNLRAKTQNLQQALTFTQSQEIRNDRQVSSQILTDQAPNGDLGCELSFGTFDDFYAATMQNPWTTGAVQGASVASTTTFGVASNAGIIVGSILRASGYTNAANNGVMVASASTGGTVTVPGPMVAEAAAGGKQIKVIGFKAAAGDITAAVGGLGSTVADFTTMALAVGQWIKIGQISALASTGFATTANNDYARISGIAAHLLSLDNLPTGWAVDAGAGKTIALIFGEYVRNGSAQTSYTLEREHTDVGQWFDFKGMFPEKCSQALQTGQVIDLTFTFRGLSSVQQSTGTLSASAPITQTTTDVQNASGNVNRVFEGGASPAGRFKQLTIEFANALRDQKAVGVVGNVGVGNGLFSAMFSFQAYFKDATFYQKFLKQTPTILAQVSTDNSGNAYIYTIPKGVITACTIQAGAINTDVTLQSTVSAEVDPVTGVMFQIDRIPTC